MENQFFKCGCAIRDVGGHWGSETVKLKFEKCKKHRKEMKSCSWSVWAKENASAQYRKWKSEIGK